MAMAQQCHAWQHGCRVDLNSRAGKAVKNGRDLTHTFLFIPCQLFFLLLAGNEHCDILTRVHGVCQLVQLSARKHDFTAAAEQLLRDISRALR